MMAMIVIILGRTRSNRALVMRDHAFDEVDIGIARTGGAVSAFNLPIDPLRAWLKGPVSIAHNTEDALFSLAVGIKKATMASQTWPAGCAHRTVRP